MHFSKTNVYDIFATLNGVELLAWLTDVLEWLTAGRSKAVEFERRLPWKCQAERIVTAVHVGMLSRPDGACHGVRKITDKLSILC